MLFQILGSTAGQAIRSEVKASGEPPIAQLMDLFSGDSDSSLTSEFWKLCEWRAQFRDDYHEYWRASRELTAVKRAVDAVILPVAPHAAPPEGSFKYYGMSNMMTISLFVLIKVIAYSAVPSLLDYTVGVVPVTFADRRIDHEQLQYTPLNDRDKTNWRLCEFLGLENCHKHAQTLSTGAADDKNTFDGSPVGVQIMGQRLQEEKVLALMGAVEGALQQYRQP